MVDTATKGGVGFMTFSSLSTDLDGNDGDAVSKGLCGDFVLALTAASLILG